MRRSGRGALYAAFFLAVLAVATPVAAQDDQAEIALWRAVTARGLRSDYEGYLLLFPKGQFAALARLRIGQADGQAPAPTPPQSAAHRPQGTGDAGLYRLDVYPPVAMRGQPIIVRGIGFLPPALYDLVLVVRAGAPDFSPAGAVDEGTVAARFLAHLVNFRDGFSPLPLPAGSYEVRYVSRQYNPEGRQEVMARAPLTIQ